MYSKRSLYETRNYNYNVKLKNGMEYNSHLKKLLEIGNRDNKYAPNYNTTNSSFRNTSRSGISLSKF
jgi:hypothetical protein